VANTLYGLNVKFSLCNRNWTQVKVILATRPLLVNKALQELCGETRHKTTQRRCELCISSSFTALQSVWRLVRRDVPSCISVSVSTGTHFQLFRPIYLSGFNAQPAIMSAAQVHIQYLHMATAFFVWGRRGEVKCNRRRQK